MNPITTAYQKKIATERNPEANRTEPNPNYSKAEQYRQAVDEAWGKEEKTPEDVTIEAGTVRHAVKMAESEAKIEKSITEAEQSRSERAGLKPRMSNLSPEEHGQVVGDLVAGFIKAGVSPDRAYNLAMRTLNPEAALDQGDKSPTGSQLTDKIVLSILQKALDNIETGPRSAAANPQGIDNRNPAQAAAEVFQSYRNLGEAYMKSIGLDPEQLAEMRRKPEGDGLLTGVGTNVGGNIDLQIRLLQLQDEQRRHWHEFEQQTKAFDAEERRTQEDHEERIKSRQSVRAAIEENLGPAIETGREFLNKRRDTGEQSRKASVPPAIDEWEAVCTECQHSNVIPAGTDEFKCEKCGADLRISVAG